MSPTAVTPDQFSTFGELLRHLRRRARITQRELAIAVGYSDTQISRIEKNQRVPDAATITALFVPALYIEDEPTWAARLLELAKARQDELHQVQYTSLPPLLDWQIESLETEETIFVAREAELARLNEHLNLVLEGHGRVVLITGEAGSGKTALLREFARRAHLAAEDLLVTSGYCNAQIGQGDPFMPFRQILRQLTCDIQMEPEGRILRHNHLHRLLNSAVVAIHALVEHGAALINTFISSPTLRNHIIAVVPEKVGWLERLDQLNRDQARGYGDLGENELYEQFENVLQAIALQKPLLLLLDDLHWADAASISLFFHLGRRLQDSRILLVGAFRPDEAALGRGGERHPLDSAVNELKRQYGEIEIDLDQARGREFVETWLDSEPNELGAAFRATLYRHTQGQPLFTVELLRVMKEQEEIVRNENGSWVEGSKLVWGHLPARTEAVIEERIARLPEALREILITASVEGEVFTAQVVAQVRGIEERNILQLLSRELEKRHRLIRKLMEVRLNNRMLTRFQFAHALFQQYVYHRLGVTERQMLHGEVADALTELYKGQTERITLQLAHHFAEAGSGEKAVEYLLKAGDQARGLYAHQEAISAYRRAFSFLKEMGQYDQAARALMKLGLTYHLSFDFQQARQSYDEGFALWQRMGEMQQAEPLPAPHALRLNWSDPLTLDPNLATDKASIELISQLFCGLVLLNPELDIVPEVARTWDVLDGGRTYVFHLRDDVCWSDGTELTADDFAYAWRRLLHPASPSPYAGLLFDIKGARAYHQGEVSESNRLGIKCLDKGTLVVDLEGPTGYFPYLLAYSVAYPVPQKVVEVYGKTWTEMDHFITNGPFRLESWQKGQSMVLTRNPNYYEGIRGNVQRVELSLQPFTDWSARLASYEAEDLDVLDLRELPIEIVDRARQRHAGEYFSVPRPATDYVAFDVSQPPFDDVRVRRAFVLAADRKALADVAWKGYHFPATGGFIPPGMPGHSAGMGLPYNPEQARQLLAEAGYPDGRGFPATNLLTHPLAKSMSERLRLRWWEILGVKIVLETAERGVFFDRLNETQPAMFLSGWWADYPDPDNFLRVSHHIRFTQWRNEVYTGLVERARRVINQEERLKLYRQADRIIVEEAAIMPLYYWREHMLVKPWVSKFPTSALKLWYLKDVIINPH